MKSSERFTSHWGLIVSIIGIAIGTGNIWRFPRIAAANGGGTFLIPWILFLFCWSIPLIIAEFAIGRHTRKGTIGSFVIMMGDRFAWMGGFVGFVTTAIMFYYSVVAGWCLRYFLGAAIGTLFQAESHQEYWDAFTGSGWQPFLFHAVAISCGILVIRRGIARGIERTNRVLIPVLLLLMVASAIRAVTLPGAMEGLKFMFTPEWALLADHNIWIQALTQNAWDTGAGWGLILTYAVYMKKKEDIPMNALFIGIGNNTVSLLAGVTVFCAVFALAPDSAESLITSAGPANTGLTFIWIPQLFLSMPGGKLFTAFFFLALSFAALSSLISMLEMTSLNLCDLGMKRKNALSWVYAAALLCGIPSALNIGFLVNQDWTWGMGLMVSGACISIAVIVFGADRFRTEKINQEGNRIILGRYYNLLIKYAIPVQVTVLIGWWFYTVIVFDPKGWWNPLSPESVGTCLAQWSLIIIVLLILNQSLAGRIRKQ
jgi:neurotransmitter:Na+ symporter, NSS family